MKTTKDKKLFSVPVMWSMTGTMWIEADDAAEAARIAEEAPLPSEGDSSYLEGSFEIFQEDIRQESYEKNKSIAKHFSDAWQGR